MRALSLKGRLDILCVLTETPGLPKDVAKRLNLKTAELNRRMAALHDNGIVVLEDNGMWRLSPRLDAVRLGKFITFALDTGDGLKIEFGIIWPKPKA